MAVDEAILERYADGAGVARAPTLRLYSWARPTLSLGRGQDARASFDASHLRSEGIDLVRRPTGGAAVLHEHERTYAVVGRLREAPFPEGVLDTYRRIAYALVAALRHLGLDARATPPRPREGRVPRSSLCFEEVSSHEIAVGAIKLVGSAQLRRRGAFLQHGSILLRANPLRAASVRSSGAGIEDVLGRRVDPRDLDEALIRGFAEVFNVEMAPGELSADEAQSATCLRNAKYRSPEWTLGGPEVAGATPALGKAASSGSA